MAKSDAPQACFAGTEGTEKTEDTENGRWP